MPLNALAEYGFPHIACIVCVQPLSPPPSHPLKSPSAHSLPAPPVTPTLTCLPSPLFPAPIPPVLFTRLYLGWFEQHSERACLGAAALNACVTPQAGPLKLKLDVDQRCRCRRGCSHAHDVFWCEEGAGGRMHRPWQHTDRALVRRASRRMRDPRLACRGDSADLPDLRSGVIHCLAR